MARRTGRAVPSRRRHTGLAVRFALALMLALSAGPVVMRVASASPVTLRQDALVASRPQLPAAQSAVEPRTPVAPTGSVSARLSRPVISIDQTVTLTVTAYDVEGELDTAALEAQFDVVGRSRSSQVQDINGVRRASRGWALELSPRGVGIFTVPSVRVGSVQSELQSLEVTEPPVGADRDLFVEMDVDTRQPWVRSQILLTVRVFDALDILGGALGEPAGEQLLVRQLGEDSRTTLQRDGRRYSVTERRYAVSPQSSGTLTIEPVTLQASVSADRTRVRGFFTPSTRVTRRSLPIPLQVRARPADNTGWWLPAAALDLQGEWSSDAASGPRDDGDGAPTGKSGGSAADEPVDAVVGEPITRTLTVRALGVLDNQFPSIAVPDVEGASLYADEPSVRTGVIDAGILSEQQVSWAVIPTRAGTLELPAVTIDWFDTRAGEPRTTTLPAARLEVSPARGSSASVAPVAHAMVDPPGDEQGIAATGREPAALPGLATLERRIVRWQAIAMIAVAAWAATMFGWLLSHRRARGSRDRANGERAQQRRAAQDERQAFERLRRACKTGAPVELADATLAWARAALPDRSPASLTALATRLEPAPAAAVLRSLDASLYGVPVTSARRESGSEAYLDLAEQLAAAVAQGRTDAPGATSGLPAL